jgi:hypothetical protein
MGSAEVVGEAGQRTVLAVKHHQREQRTGPDRRPLAAGDRQGLPAAQLGGAAVVLPHDRLIDEHLKRNGDARPGRIDGRALGVDGALQEGFGFFQIAADPRQAAGQDQRLHVVLRRIERGRLLEVGLQRQLEHAEHRLPAEHLRRFAAEDAEQGIEPGLVVQAREPRDRGGALAGVALGEVDEFCLDGRRVGGQMPGELGECCLRLGAKLGMVRPGGRPQGGAGFGSDLDEPFAGAFPLGRIDGDEALDEVLDLLRHLGRPANGGRERGEQQDEREQDSHVAMVRVCAGKPQAATGLCMHEAA